MRISDVLKGAIIATAAAGLFGCASQQKTSTMPEAMSGGEMVKCAGVNQCAGHGQCGAADGSHACAGKNACKGKGWVKVSPQECQDKGGTPM